MEVKDAYNDWAGQYDTNENKTRDLEAMALRSTLKYLQFDSCLEMGCGTGKNTSWIIQEADEVLAVDFSSNMLEKAKLKVDSQKVAFVQADITEPWSFIGDRTFSLAIFSLVLEHIESLETVFSRLTDVINENGYVYIGELHPFKQYNGSKARFETSEGLQVVTCYTHHLSDFTTAASNHGFQIVTMNEFFDNDDRTGIPRLLTLLFQKNNENSVACSLRILLDRKA